MNKHRYNRVVLLATDIVNLNKKHPSKELASKSQKKLLDTADELQKIVLKNKNASDIASVSEPLAGIYDSFIQIVDENDPRVAKAHYNLAETLFLIKQYERAAQNYRWIVSRGMDNHKDVADSAIKAIASRYEVLSEKKLLPQKIEPKKLKDGDDDYSSDPRDEWLAWIDAYVERNETIDETFYYEANRLLYDSGRVKRAIERMKKFALRQPKSKYAIASATLAIDTYILSEAWDDLHDSAMVMLKVKAWTTPEFVTMLHKVNTEALYKIAEREYKKENYAEALYKSDLFLKEYKEKSPVRNAFLSMAGHSAYKEKKLSQALKYYSELVEAAAGTSYASEALLSKGKIAEELYDFAAASRDYQQYMNYPGAKIDDYRERVLLLSWMSGSKDIQEQALNSKTLCKGVAKAEDLCARYEALFYLTDKPVDGATIAYAEKNLQTSSLKHLWALYLLVHDTKPSFKTRNDRLKLFSKVWDKLEGLEQIALLHYINSALLKNIEQGREELAAVAPLKGKEKDILFRIQKMREYEAAVEAVVQMPWVRIKAHGLNQLAETYYGFVNELRSVPTPKDFSAADKEAYEKMIAEILMPFEEKAATLREKAFEIVNKFDVESETGKPIVEAFLKENPSQAKSYREKELITKHYKMGHDMLSVYDVNGDWETLRSDCQGAAQCTKYHWLQAIRKSDWRKAAHYLQVVNKEKLLPERSMMLMRAVSLATMGSRGEALQEVSDINLVVSAEVR
jgi:TolA-binding protein